MAPMRAPQSGQGAAKTGWPKALKSPTAMSSIITPLAGDQRTPQRKHADGALAARLAPEGVVVEARITFGDLARISHQSRLLARYDVAGGR
jgi:hypothetical protein